MTFAECGADANQTNRVWKTKPPSGPHVQGPDGTIRCVRKVGMYFLSPKRAKMQRPHQKKRPRGYRTRLARKPARIMLQMRGRGPRDVDSELADWSSLTWLGVQAWLGGQTVAKTYFELVVFWRFLMSKPLKTEQLRPISGAGAIMGGVY